MNSVRESKQELEASIRYAENAISSAKQTIESMEFRQEMAKKNYQEQTGREEALQREVAELKVQLTDKTAQADNLVEEIKQLRSVKFGTLPVIPRDVAIAIFREGVLFGVNAACDEIEGERINISENDYVGDFSVSFERDIELDDVIDFDWVRSKIGDYDEDNVTANLEGLCARKNFQCRIYGIDDQGNDSTSS